MRALVTGGGGFVGGALVRELLARGHAVRSVSRGAYPELEALGVETRRADLADARALSEACEGVDLVFHVAALTGVWGPCDAFRRTNVEGTRNVVAACRARGVARLVFTSSPSVCFDGRDHVLAANELPYARRFLAPYPETKAIAERIVLEANGREGLVTCALRPHLAFGPGDPHLLPRIVERAAKRRLVRVGDGRNEVSLSFVENVAVAHALAGERLETGAKHAGRAYFIAQEEPVRLWDWIGELLERLELPAVRRRVPRGLAYSAGAVLEMAWRALGLDSEPPMTRFVAAQLASSHSYSLEPAKRDFGYRERVGMEEAVERTVGWLKGASLGSARE